MDDFHAELVKYGSDDISEGIAEIRNETAETGIPTMYVKGGILMPLQKPGKKRRTTRQFKTYNTFINA